MAHRAANRANAPEVDMRCPKSKQVRAGDNTPCAVSVIGGIAGSGKAINQVRRCPVHERWRRMQPHHGQLNIQNTRRTPGQASTDRVMVVFDRQRRRP
jgi:hypothetical protein